MQLFYFQKRKDTREVQRTTDVPKQSNLGEAPMPTSNITQGTSPSLCLMKKDNQNKTASNSLDYLPLFGLSIVFHMFGFLF
jgi:hypothetical protein